MPYRIGLTLTLLFAASPSALAATKGAEPPDKEMLRMMEFLKEMEMIKQLELLQELHHVDSVGDQEKNSRSPKAAPVPQKGTPK